MGMEVGRGGGSGRGAGEQIIGEWRHYGTWGERIMYRDCGDEGDGRKCSRRAGVPTAWRAC